MEIKIVNESNNQIPEYATEESAGVDLRAFLEEPITIEVGQRKLIHTGIKIKLPKSYVGLVCPRSGLAMKKGITVLNAPGIIDSDYTGDIGVILYNAGTMAFTVNNGDRIAQLVITKHNKAEWVEVDSLEDTERGDGGFGHSGVK